MALDWSDQSTLTPLIIHHQCAAAQETRSGDAWGEETKMVRQHQLKYQYALNLEAGCLIKVL